MPDVELRRREAEVEAALSRRYRSDRGFGVGYDRAACSAINPLSSEVVKVWAAQGGVNCKDSAIAAAPE